MIRISTELQDFIKGKLGWVATADINGVPNVTPKGTIKVLDQTTLVFADLFSLNTRENMLNNPSVAVTVVDLERAIGYQFKGSVELIHDGTLFEELKTDIMKSSKKIPEPKYFAKITVEEIYDQSPGENAGKKI